VVNVSPVSLGNYVYPSWADGIGWLMFALAVTLIPIFAVGQAVKLRHENPALSAKVNKFLNTIQAIIDGE